MGTALEENDDLGSVVASSAEASVRRGSWNQDVCRLRISSTLAIDQRCEKLRRQRRDVYKLGLGQSPFPVPQAVVGALRENAHQKDYLPVEGLPSLREAVAAYVYRTQRVSYSADHVLIGPGSKELLFLLQLVFEGEILIPTPAWVSYAPQARIAGRPVLPIHTSAARGWKLTPEQLDDVCRGESRHRRLLILNYPSNPTGASYDAHELRELAEVARRHNLLVLSDEIYSELNYARRHVSIIRYYAEGTILSSGLSKWCGAGGWRLGTFAFPPELRWCFESMTAVASESFTSVSAPIQYAAVSAYEGCAEIEQYLSCSTRLLAALAMNLVAQLDALGIRAMPPQGGFYVFADFGAWREVLAGRGITQGRQLCEILLEDTGVAMLPGSDFGRSNDELTARIAFVDFDGAAALAGIRALPGANPVPEGFLREHCGRLFDAIQQIRTWLASQANSLPLVDAPSNGKGITCEAA